MLCLRMAHLLPTRLGEGLCVYPRQVVTPLITVKQHCCWKIVVRRMQGVRSIVSTHLYAEEKKHFLFAYDVPMTFQTHFCFTILFQVILTTSCSSFVGLLAPCLSYFLGVARYAFKNKARNMLTNQAKSAQAQLPIWVYLNPFCRVFTQVNHLIKSGSDTRKLMHLQASWPYKAHKHKTYVRLLLVIFSLPLLMGSVVQHSHSKVNIVVFYFTTSL